MPLADHQAALHDAETRLLYENASASAGITITVAALLAYAQWEVVPHAVTEGWLTYMSVVSIARFALASRYRRSSTEIPGRRWRTRFVIGTALAAAGWGGGAIALYPSGAPMNEVLLVFVIGGVMLGSASLLAARPEAFLTFLIPTGLVTSWRVASQGDEQHLIMGFLGVVFTLATIFTTWRFYLAIESSFRLGFANEDLIESLRQAKDHADALNRELELRVGDRTAKLLEADQRKDEFLATLAHELRNPLAPIRFALETLKGGAPLATAAHARDVIERQVGQLVRLVDDLLDVSRITVNKIQLRREPHDLGLLMTHGGGIDRAALDSGRADARRAAAAAGHLGRRRRRAAGAGVRQRAEQRREVHASRWPHLVHRRSASGCRDPADPGHRRRHRGGHVAAGVRHVPPGRAGARAVHRRTRHRPDTWRAPSSRCTKARLTSAVRAWARARRSRSVCRSARRRPRRAIMAAEPPRVVASRRLRVLIVEDNIDAAEMLQLAVSLLGHIARMAHDGASAIAAVSEFAPDVIFLDIGLPVMNGYAVAEQVRALPEGRLVHIAAVTGWGQEEDRRKAREAGCDSHFTKPLSPAMLDELLAQIAARPQEEARGVSLESSPRRTSPAP